MYQNYTKSGYSLIILKLAIMFSKYTCYFYKLNLSLFSVQSLPVVVPNSPILFYLLNITKDDWKVLGSTKKPLKKIIFGHQVNLIDKYCSVSNTAQTIQGLRLVSAQQSGEWHVPEDHDFGSHCEAVITEDLVREPSVHSLILLSRSFSRVTLFEMFPR